MKKLLITICLVFAASIAAKAGLVNGGEYYIWLNIYEKLLCSKPDNSPALSAYKAERGDSCVFVAEESGENDYFLLRQKSSGMYLAASGSNSYSVTLESRSTADRFRWKMTGPDCYAYLTNKKNTKSYLGIDGAKKGADYVSIYYDKPKGSHGQFSVIPAEGTWNEARQVYESAVYTNAQGVQEIDYCQLKDKEIDRSDAVDIHITANDNPMLGNSKVNLGSDRTWLIFDNIAPSKVISTYLKYVTINGVTAQKDVNCRVAIYLNGAAVIPLPETVMSCEGTAGSFTLAVGSHTNLSSIEQSNTMTSFVLRRGYMATLATGTNGSGNGSGYSRVYVADHSDLTVTLPEALMKRVSSVYVKKWQYLSKKGWGDTKGTTRGPELRATWYWCWNGDQWSTSDMEYVPCRQHRYWPSVSTVNEHASTATLSINEPEHSEQHTKSDCACSDNWTNCTLMPDYLPSGARIGSCQPTDFSWLKEFFGHVDDMAYRCDFAVTHAYWTIGSMNATKYADWFCNTKCKEVWNNVKRPLWLTELEISASWNKYNDKKELDQDSYSYDAARNYLQTLLQKIDECPWIERYAIYAFDHWKNYMFYDDGGITPAGQVYRDHRATFAYDVNYTKEPIWWKPSVKKPTLTYSINMADQTITFNVGNGNTDATDELLIEYQPEGSDSWQTLITLSDDRNKLESNKITYTANLSDLNVGSGKFRVKATTLYGGSATSNEVAVPSIANINSEWTVCESDIIYNGMFATVHTGANYPDGWTRTNNWGQMQTDISGAFATAYYNQPGSLQYGNQEGFPLSLAANATYMLTFSYRSHEANSNKGITVSVLNGDDGVKDISFPAVGSTTEWRTVSTDIKTGAAGNYVLTLANSGNTWMTNVSMVRLVQKGDVDGDGKTDVDDVKRLVGSLLDSTTDGVINEAADVDGNGVVDISDITKLIEKILSAN